MGHVNDIWVCTFQRERVSRTEITTLLVFDPRNNTFRIRVSQDYETQAKIESRDLDADTYFANHAEHRDEARKAINDQMTRNPKHKKAMEAALTRMKSL